MVDLRCVKTVDRVDSRRALYLMTPSSNVCVSDTAALHLWPRLRATEDPWPLQKGHSSTPAVLTMAEVVYQPEGQKSANGVVKAKVAQLPAAPHAEPAPSRTHG